MLKNASEVTFVPKNIFFLKILNFVSSFMECKVSVADGTSWNGAILQMDRGLCHEGGESALNQTHTGFVHSFSQ
jgi:hypothetical protein